MSSTRESYWRLAQPLINHPRAICSEAAATGPACSSGPGRGRGRPARRPGELRCEIVDYLGMVRDQNDLSAKILDMIAQFHEPRLYLRYRDVILGLIEKQARVATHHEIQQCIEADKNALTIGKLTNATRRRLEARIKGIAKRTAKTRRLAPAERRSSDSNPGMTWRR